MTDFSQFSNDLERERQLADALSDIEQALSRFELAITKHLPAIQAMQAMPLQKNNTKTLLNRSLGTISGLLAIRGGRLGTISTPNTHQTNRFPTSSGQLYADLWAAIQRIGRRNL